MGDSSPALAKYDTMWLLLVKRNKIKLIFYVFLLSLRDHNFTQNGLFMPWLCKSRLPSNDYILDTQVLRSPWKWILKVSLTWRLVHCSVSNHSFGLKVNKALILFILPNEPVTYVNVAKIRPKTLHVYQK